MSEDSLPSPVSVGDRNPLAQTIYQGLRQGMPILPTPEKDAIAEAEEFLKECGLNTDLISGDCDTALDCIRDLLSHARQLEQRIKEVKEGNDTWSGIAKKAIEERDSLKQRLDSQKKRREDWEYANKERWLAMTDQEKIAELTTKFWDADEAAIELKQRLDGAVRAKLYKDDSEGDWGLNVTRSIADAEKLDELADSDVLVLPAQPIEKAV